MIFRDKEPFSKKLKYLSSLSISMVFVSFLNANIYYYDNLHAAMQPAFNNVNKLFSPTSA